jgi:Flp pilus assembly pilin Flp
MWLRRESGQTLAEYGLVLVLVAVAVVAVVEALGGGIANFLSGLPSAL